MPSHTVQRRRFRRITVIQTATLSQHTGSIAGEIRDFSPNGVLFTFTQSASTAALHNQLVTIEFRPNLAVTKQYRIVGRVVRVFDLSIGVTVDNFPANAYRDLVLLTEQPQQPVSPATAARYSQGQIAAALGQCHAQFKSFIAQLIANFYNTLAAKLAYSAEHVGSLEERWLLHNAYPLVAAQRSRIEQVYLGDDYLKRDTQDAAAEEVIESQGLALVDEDEFDDWVAASQLVYKLNLEYAYDIGKFEAAYARLTGTALNENANPFGPHYIFQTLRDLLASDVFKKQVKTVLYKAWYEAAMGLMSQFYAELNETLAFARPPRAAGARPGRAARSLVLADVPLSESVHAYPQHAVSAGHAGGMSLDDFLQKLSLGMQNPLPAMPANAKSPSSYPVFAANGGVATAAQPAMQDYGLQQLLGQLHQLQLGSAADPDYQALGNQLRDLPVAHPPSNSYSASVIPAMHELLATQYMTTAGQSTAGSVQSGASGSIVQLDDLGQILEVLNVIQQQRAGNGHVQDDISIKRQLLAALPQFENASRQDRVFQSIHLFDEMLSTPLSDDVLNSDIRSLLKKIELTLLKLALLDGNFLKSSDHPAQQTVNLLERFYVAADDMGKLFDPQLQRLLNSLANQIVDQFENQPAVFAEVNKILVNLLVPIEDTRQHKVAQIQQACDLREQLETAGLAVDANPATDEADASGINLLRQGDWLSVLVDDVLVPYQLIWVGKTARRFVLTSRSAMTIREFSRAALLQDLLDGHVMRLPEYDIPFMERSAHKIMLNTYERVYQQAMHDPVSGLLNRKGMITQLESIFAREEVQQRRGILCMMMFDQLNLIYHNCEAAEAEASLMALIGVIANEVKATDVFARLGENTFAILLHDNEVAHAQLSMQTVVAALGQQRIRCQGKQFAVAVNVGIAQIDDEVDSVSKLLRNVGSACVAAKARGANSVQAYSADSIQIRHEQSLFEWAGAIDRVLNEGLLFLRCQRIQPVDTGNGRLPHYEILLGIDKQLATNPQEFILAAEKWHRSADIDLWVLQHSFDWLRAQGDKLVAISGISINLSGHSLTNSTILSYLVGALQAGQVPADKIIFEITETAVMNRLESAQRFIETIRAFGCRFSLDDFGSGYASFAYLKHLQVDYLKIDGVFIRDLAKSPADLAMVKSMHQVGHALGLRTIAEYVENQAIMAILGDIGVDYAQGYGIEISKPLSTLML